MADLITPKAGKIKIYTSGWAKNQKSCWKRTTSPPLMSKYLALKFRSIRSMVMPPAKTGRDRIRRNPVIRIDQLNTPTLFVLILLFCQTDVKKLILDIIEETPAICSLKMTASILFPG